MYSAICLVGVTGSFVVMAGCLAVLWFGLRTILNGLLLGQPDVVHWVIVFASGLAATVISLVLLTSLDRRRGRPQTLVYEREECRWIPVSGRNQ